MLSCCTYAHVLISFLPSSGEYVSFSRWRHTSVVAPARNSSCTTLMMARPSYRGPQSADS